MTTDTLRLISALTTTASQAITTLVKIVEDILYLSQDSPNQDFIDVWRQTNMIAINAEETIAALLIPRRLKNA